MTSNMIAYATAVEGVRHDKVTEEETNRHNVATEELTERANAIDAERNTINERYNTRKLELESQYNEWYMKFTAANEQRKRELEAEGNAIQHLIAENTRIFQDETNRLKSKQQEIDKAINAETYRHNVEMERYNTEALRVTQWLNEAKVNLETYSTLENLGLKREELEVRRLENQTRADIAFNSNILEAANIGLRTAQTELNINLGAKSIEETNQRMWWTPFTNFWGGVSNAGRGLSPFIFGH